MMIHLEQVSKHYQMGQVRVTALDSVSLTIGQGEFVVVLGPSGSGKTTLLNIIGALDVPGAGIVRINGDTLSLGQRGDRFKFRRETVSFIFQTFNLFPGLTALENVQFVLDMAGAPCSHEQAVAVLTSVGLGQRVNHFPHELSGGEQQRVAIARALVNRPAILLADEPTGNLDSATGAEIMALLNQLNREQGVTLLAVTHDPEVAAFARRVVRLKDGQIINDTLDGMPVEKLQVEG
ncbi:MAG TPA: ABC transporter ATP-binding protein [Chloroflexi bacterium]|nr:ABC transporter ATP-binding protein [Chloroflexota bacterium]